MSLLYQRLALDLAEARLVTLQRRSIDELRQGARYEDDEATVAATGGAPAGPEHTRKVIETLRGLAEQHGYPNPPSTQLRVAFDRKAAIALHRTMQVTLSEAADRGIWTFLGLVAGPDVVAWRWGTSANAERWICKDITRHALGRLWWQAEALADVDVDGERSYDLIGVLTESELNQVFERRRIGGQPALARAIARYACEMKEDDVSRRVILREVIKRLLRALPFTALAIFDDDHLDHTIRAYAADAMRSVAKP